MLPDLLKGKFWYRHVRSDHSAIYYGRDIQHEDSGDPGEQHSEQHSDEHSDEQSDEHSDEHSEHGDEQHQYIDIFENYTECANLRFIDDIGDPSSESVDSDQIAPSDTENACFMSHDVAAGILVSLKEKHHLSQPALDEVVEMTEAICGHVLDQANSEVLAVAQRYNVDSQSPFIQELLQCLGNISSPLTGLHTAYRQQKYVETSFPYVVCYLTL